MTHCLVYVSCSRRLLPPQELTQLLRHSRSNNAKLGITGLLLYVDGNFMQALEGPESAIVSLYEHIKQDPRHGGVRLILSQEIAQPLFPDWSMAFRAAADLPQAESEGVSSFLADIARGDAAEPVAQNSLALNLLERFALTMQ